MKTSDLIGPALDWAVARTLGYMPAKWEKRQWGRELVLAPEREFSNQLRSSGGCPLRRLGFEPSTDWDQGGPIIERERIKVGPNIGGSWSGQIRQEVDDGTLSGLLIWTNKHGPTPLIAAMRCLVASKLGNEVDVPKELL